MSFQETYKLLVDELSQIATLESIDAVLGWDQETYLPSEAIEHRGDQSALISGIVHSRSTSSKINDLLCKLEENIIEASFVEKRNIEKTRKEYNDSIKFTQEFVEESAKLLTLAQDAWAKAREEKNYNQFKPWLKKILELKYKEIEILGSKAEKYDTLLDQYESGFTTKECKEMFNTLKPPLVELIQKVKDSNKNPVSTNGFYDLKKQEIFVRNVVEKIGFNFSQGRIDSTTHPFCTSLGPKDTRLTTRYDENNFESNFYSVIHEMGHGLYDQGLPKSQYGLPSGSDCSLGIHESQSRFWENLIGRSQGFWDYLYPEFENTFKTGISKDNLIFSINKIEPSFIRTEADQMTYNLHILIRFEIELGLINGEISLDDLPEVWNQKYKEYLGIVPSNDAEVRTPGGSPPPTPARDTCRQRARKTPRGCGS